LRSLLMKRVVPMCRDPLADSVRLSNAGRPPPRRQCAHHFDPSSVNRPILRNPYHLPERFTHRSSVSDYILGSTTLRIKIGMSLRLALYTPIA
jgi:hypothetical protein